MQMNQVLKLKYLMMEIIDLTESLLKIQNEICNYIPRIRRIGGCYGFTSKPPAARHPPPAMVLTR